MRLEEAERIIKRSMQRPLPGFSAHMSMMPLGRNSSEFTEEAIKGATVSGVLILLYEFERNVYSVLIERNVYYGVHSGQIGLPGGKMDSTDKNITETAIRECFEEIGVGLTTQNIIGQLSPLYIPPSHILAYPVVATIPHKPSFTPETKEVKNIITYNIELLFDDNNIRQKEFKALNYSIYAPYYNILDNCVWGATAMILSEFKELLTN